MKNKKINQSLLNEELKKFKLISEYNFYVPQDETKEMIYGDLIGEVDEEPNPDDIAKNLSQELGVDDKQSEPKDSDQSTEEQPAEPQPSTPQPSTPQPDEFEIDDSDEEEIDVTELVNKTNGAKKAAKKAEIRTVQLIKQFKELENKLSKMDNITSKIENLEKEIVKRNPTPIEKLNMRSLDSYPYNIKLSDYWSEKEGYQARPEKEEYILDKNMVDDTYSEFNVKNSFNNIEYDEEDI